MQGAPVAGVSTVRFRSRSYAVTVPAPDPGVHSRRPQTEAAVTYGEPLGAVSTVVRAPPV